MTPPGADPPLPADLEAAHRLIRELLATLRVEIGEQMGRTSGDDRRVIGTHPIDFRILRVSRQDTTEHGAQGCSRWTISHGSEGPTATT
jgi:hypothetical protein